MGKIVEKVKARRAKKKDLNITQQNLKESRDEILNKGKKFKYPFQYAKHRVVIYTIAITIVAFASFAGVGWYQLYKAQNTGEVMFRFTKVLRLPVAKVDGVDVLYSDYLMLYRSSIASIERQQGKMDDMNDEVKSQKLFYKRQALDNAEMYSYVLARLDERNLTVSASEIDEVIDEHKSINGEKRSNEAFEGIAVFTMLIVLATQINNEKYGQSALFVIILLEIAVAVFNTVQPMASITEDIQSIDIPMNYLALYMRPVIFASLALVYRTWMDLYKAGKPEAEM